jgi:hypothetical protein
MTSGMVKTLNIGQSAAKPLAFFLKECTIQKKNNGIHKNTKK